MISRALNANNDIFVENGSFRTVTDGAEVLQHVRSRLLFYRGEWFLNLSSGVPYFESIFVKPANLANVESILKSTILNTPGVEKLIAFSMNYDNNARALSVTFTAETVYGEINNEEVTINA